MNATILAEKTGIAKVKIYALVHRLKQQGKIETKIHGTYVKRKQDNVFLKKSSNPRKAWSHCNIAMFNEIATPIGVRIETEVSDEY